MKLYRNPEVRRELLTYMAVTLILAAAGFTVAPAAGGFVLLCGTALTLVHYIFTGKRYRRIEHLSQSIDSILHGQSEAVISSANEGELAILNSEIQKMLIRMKEQSDRLSADKIRLTDAIADIFHQLRTPITSMMLSVSMLSGEELSFDRRLELTRELKRQIERTQWLVEALLKMSQIDAGAIKFRKDAVSVKELIDKACEPFIIPMELREQTFTVTASRESFTGDLHWTAEALGNIIKNCVEHTPIGGSISVTARETPIFTEITVCDSGTGFAAEDIPHLFERFYKGRNASAQSIGIGLALARAVISAQNGTLKAANRIGTSGAVFTLKLYKTVV